MMQVMAAYIIDILIGDPRWIPHPVVIIGKGIDYLEKFLRRSTVQFLGQRAAGIILTVMVVSITFLVSQGIMAAAYKINFWFGLLLGIWLLSTTFATKGLSGAALEIFNLLKRSDLDQARLKVGWIVGRDTGGLDEGEITRATVETVAENIVDGIIAPMFYAFLGGIPLAMAYKAVNTLDSMVGYKNEKYREFGWASARFDDICNYVPARLTGLLMIFCFFIMGKPVQRAVHIMMRDAEKHPSPNSGIPESAMAGCLGVRLGGLNYYGGISSFRAYLGDPTNPLEKEHIREAVKIMHGAAFAGIVAGSFLYWSFCQFFNKPLWW